MEEAGWTTEAGMRQCGVTAWLVVIMVAGSSDLIAAAAATTAGDRLAAAYPSYIDKWANEVSREGRIHAVHTFQRFTQTISTYMFTSEMKPIFSQN